LDIGSIQRDLTTRRLGRRIELHQRLDSTNAQAVALAQAGAEHGTLVLAETQTAGRGRMARAWFSPPGVNVYASIIIRLPMDGPRTPAWLSWLPLMAALGAADAVEAVTPARVAVKWPNDLLIADRKAGGILCESATTRGTGPFQVIGIGINVNGGRQDFPEDLQETATTIEEQIGRVVDRNRLVSRLLYGIESCLDEFLARGSVTIAPAYRRRCVTIGKTVKAVLSDGTECIGVVQGIAEDGSLSLIEHTSPTATVRQLRAADIIHLR
jgi:BirA family biotin operon repressor/biotin-[acetyl-CoA-carboxylase] ligase